MCSTWSVMCDSTESIRPPIQTTYTWLGTTPYWEKIHLRVFILATFPFSSYLPYGTKMREMMLDLLHGGFRVFCSCGLLQLTEPVRLRNHLKQNALLLSLEKDTSYKLRKHAVCFFTTEYVASSFFFFNYVRSFWKSDLRQVVGAEVQNRQR